jgi:hypothetical protein
MPGKNQAIRVFPYEQAVLEELNPEGYNSLVELPDALALGAACDLPDPSTGINDIAMLQYTGGTTDVAKGAVLIPDPRDIGAMVETMKAYPFTALAMWQSCSQMASSKFATG